MSKAEKTFVTSGGPWHPMSDPVDLMYMGKLAEELNECGAATVRCMLQGIDECEPSTGEINREWLTKEIADVLANAELVIEHFDLDYEMIKARKVMKRDYLKKWHNDA